MTGVARYSRAAIHGAGVVGYRLAGPCWALVSSSGVQWFDPVYPAGQRPSLSSAHPQDVQS